MDTQDSLIFSVSFKNNINKKCINLNDIPCNNVLIEFNENAEINVEVNSLNYRVFIECSDEKSNCDKKYMHLLENNVNFELSSHEDSLYSSIYSIIIENIKTNVKTYRNYRVLPLIALDDKDMFTALRAVISSFSKTLLYDFNREKNMSIIERERSIKVLPTICNYLIDNSSLILDSLHNVTNNQIALIEKNVVQSNNLGKQSEKSIIKNILKDNRNFSIKTNENYNCVENSTLVFYLKESSNKLIETDEQIQHILSLYKNRVSSYKNSINNANSKVLKDRLSKEKEKIETISKLFGDTRKLISTILYKINNLLYYSNLSNIKTKKVTLTEKFQKNRYYKTIYERLYLTLTNGANIGISYSSAMNEVGYSYKNTASLYEIYCFIVLISILENNKFVVNPELQTFNILDLDFVDSNVVMNYTNGKIFCKLIYDKKIETIRNKPFQELTNVNSNHDKPDFQLLFFDSDNNLIHSTILDSKCRRYKYIMIESPDGKENKDIIDIVTDYVQFRYIKSGSIVESNKSAVNDLFLLCPDITFKNVVKDPLYGVIFLPLKPNFNISLDLGYKYLNSYIKNIIKEKQFGF